MMSGFTPCCETETESKSHRWCQVLPVRWNWNWSNPVVVMMLDDVGFYPMLWNWNWKWWCQVLPVRWDRNWSNPGTRWWHSDVNHRWTGVWIRGTTTQLVIQQLRCFHIDTCPSMSCVTTQLVIQQLMCFHIGTNFSYNSTAVPAFWRGEWGPALGLTPNGALRCVNCMLKWQ